MLREIKPLEEGQPRGTDGESVDVAHHNHAILCPGEGDVNPCILSEEADVACIATCSNARYDDIRLFTSLVGVDRCDLKLPGWYASRMLKERVADTLPLTGVHADDTDLFYESAMSDESVDSVGNSGTLRKIDHRSRALRHL